MAEAGAAAGSGRPGKLNPECKVKIVIPHMHLHVVADRITE